MRGPSPNTSPWAIVGIGGSEEVAVGSLGRVDLTVLVYCIRVRVNGIIADGELELVPYHGPRSVELGSGRDA